MGQIAVRLATPDDAAAIAAVHVRAWQDGYQGLMPQEFLDAMTDQIEARSKRWQDGLATGRTGHTFVGLFDGAITGIAGAGATRDQDHTDGELLMINVIGDAWGTGVGQALLDAATDQLRADGFAHATLWVLESNRRARRFYERNGWRTDGATKDDEERGFTIHEVRYRIDLQTS